MKKILCFVLILTLLFALVSCSNPNDSADSDSINTPENDQAPSSTTTSSESMPNSEPNQKIDFTACLQTLLEGYKWNPQSIIPEKLSPDYTANFINTDNINNNYSSFIPVTNIPQNGIGEQWNMIIENLSEYQIFFNVLSVIDNLSSLSVAAFNNYIDKNPSDTAQYQFQEGIYSVTISCKQDSIDYVLDYTTTLTTLGEQSIQISLSMNTLTQVKIVRIQIGDANAVKYTVDNNKYSFAIKYLGIRRAYFELNTNSDGSLSGHIYEYLTTNSMELASVADFYITDEYLTVVGNKASDMIGFDGTICELYSISKGKMIAYEVKEKAEILGSELTYNTLWFDLEDVSGITSIKYIPTNSINEKDKIYINDLFDKWETKNYGISGGAKAASRRYDIEFRTQYFYYYDSVNKICKKEKIQVPMLFVQEEVFDDLTKDVKGKNGINISINIDSDDLTNLMDEYSSKTDLIEENKEKYSAEAIVEFIDSKKILLLG